MANRALRVGDRVVIRPSCVARIEREYRAGVTAHTACEIVDADIDGRKCFELRGPWSVRGVYAWPSEVRLADGAAERADVRFERRAAEIEAMKAARRKQKKGARKS